jgi:hypothetical protein
MERANGYPVSPEIIRPAETVSLGGVSYRFPSDREIEVCNRLVARQEQLFSEYANTTSTTEEGAGRRQQIERQVATLERMKHPLCRIINLHLLPDRYRKRVRNPTE